MFYSMNCSTRSVQVRSWRLKPRVELNPPGFQVHLASSKWDTHAVALCCRSFNHLAVQG